jgi:hypothetical protein
MATRTMGPFPWSQGQSKLAQLPDSQIRILTVIQRDLAVIQRDLADALRRSAPGGDRP